MKLPLPPTYTFSKTMLRACSVCGDSWLLLCDNGKRFTVISSSFFVSCFLVNMCNIPSLIYIIKLKDTLWTHRGSFYKRYMLPVQTLKQTFTILLRSPFYFDRHATIKIRWATECLIIRLRYCRIFCNKEIEIRLIF